MNRAKAYYALDRLWDNTNRDHDLSMRIHEMERALKFVDSPGPEHRAYMTRRYAISAKCRHTSETVTLYASPRILRQIKATDAKIDSLYQRIRDARDDQTTERLELEIAEIAKLTKTSKFFEHFESGLTNEHFAIVYDKYSNLGYPFSESDRQRHKSALT